MTEFSKQERNAILRAASTVFLFKRQIGRLQENAKKLNDSIEKAQLLINNNEKVVKDLTGFNAEDICEEIETTNEQGKKYHAAQFKYDTITPSKETL